jgi:hypothetical protein
MTEQAWRGSGPRWRIPVHPETVTTGAGVLADDTDTDPDGLYVHRLSDGTRLWRAPDPNDHA